MAGTNLLYVFGGRDALFKANVKELPGGRFPVVFKWLKLSMWATIWARDERQGQGWCSI
jgi:hypothetical protein